MKYLILIMFVLSCGFLIFLAIQNPILRKETHLSNTEKPKETEVESIIGLTYTGKIGVKICDGLYMPLDGKGGISLGFDL